MNFKKYILGFCLFFNFLNANAQRCNLNTTLDCGLITAQGGIAGGTNIIFCDSSVVPVVNTSTGVVDSTYFCWDDGKDTAVVGTRGASHFYALRPNDPCSKTFNIRMTVVNTCTQPNGSVAKSIHYIITPIVIKRKPKGAFTVSANVCTGASTSLTNTSSCVATAWKWIFGDGTVDSTNYNVTHGWTQPGNYNVRLVSIGCNGLTDTVSKTVVVHSLPISRAVTASSSSSSGCSPLVTGFSNTSLNGNTYNWGIVSGPGGWSFNTGSSATSLSPTITFRDTGLYRLRLTTTSRYCGAAVWDTNIQVRAIPIVTLLNIPDGCNSLIVRPGQMVSYTGGAPESYAWSFPNSTPTTSTVRFPPDRTYSIGNHSMSVTATNRCGSAPASTNFNVTPPPTGNFTLTLPPNNCVPANAQIQTTTSFVTSYDWQIITTGNYTYQGGTSRTSEEPQLLFTSAGTYQLRATMRGCSNIIKDTTVTLIAPPKVELDSLPDNCLPWSANPGAIVHYSEGTPVSYLWNYTGGNRITDNVRFPGPVTYDVPGQYGISVAATNICGTGRDAISFRVDSLPEVSATVFPDQSVYCLPNSPDSLKITFNNDLKYVYRHQWRVNGSGRWSFARGTNAFSPNPIIAFFDEGTYIVELEGTGCNTNTWRQTIVVKKTPIVTLDPIANACETKTVNLTNIVRYSGGTPTTYRWDFKGRNPDSTSTLQYPSALTFNPGQYDIIIKTSNECGFSADTSSFTIAPAPVIGTVVTSGNPNGCVPLNIDLQSNTQNAASYQWSVLNGTGGIDYTFQNGTNVNTQNAVLRFPNAGSYQVRLNVTGCRGAQWDTTLVLKTAPLVNLATIPTQCAPQTVLPSTLVSYTGGTPTSYLWQYAGANRNSDTVRAPNSLIFNRVGADTISVSASNVCGTASSRIIFDLKGGPQPIIAITANDTNYCNPLQLTLRSDSSIAVTTFRWTAVGATFLNGTNASSPNPVLRYGAAGTYRIALQADGCSTANWDKTVTVTIPPVVELLPVPDTCGQMTVDPSALVRYSGGTPTSYTWTFTNMSNPTSNLRVPPPVNYTQTGTYSIINRSENKCGVSIDTISFTLRNPASLVIAPLPLLCNTDTTVQLQVNPFGGVWTGASVTQAGLFNPRTAALGINTLRYSYGDGQCAATNTTDVEVSGVVIHTGSDTFVCNNAAPIFLRGQTPANGTWSGLGIIDSINGLFDPRLVTAGVHSLTYTVKNAQNRCVNQKTRQVTVFPAPKAAFDSLPLQCVGAPVQFVNRSVRMDSILWFFNHDSSRSALASVPNTYQYVGLDTVKLYVKTVNNCVDSLKRIADVVEPGIAAFTPSVNIGCGPLLPVRFTNRSSTLAGRDSLYTFIWDFGTGRRDTTRNVLDSILFRQANGDKIDTVRLTVSNICGSHTATDTIHIRPTPTARFGFQPLGSCSPLEVQFYNASPGYPTRFYWNFGNGNTSQDSAIQRQFFRTDTGTAAARRVFTVTLRVENACGSSTTQDTIGVLPPGVNADFTIDTLVGCAPFTVRCRNFSTPGSQVWWRVPKDSLGTVNPTDTLESYEQTLFTNIYHTQGFYKVMLYARSANNCGYDSTFRIIQVLPPAQISISHLPAVCTGDTITLQATSQNFFFKIWHFGDGDSARQLNARHVYRQPGDYTLTMFGNTLNGNCPVVRTSTVKIRALPKANLTVDRMDGCPPLRVNFRNFSTQAADTTLPPYAAWDFGDRNTSSTLHTNHTFDTAGYYPVRLRVTDAFGCKDDTLWSQITVHPLPDANFVAQPAATCGLPLQVQFNNQTTGASAYEWQFGNGLTSTTTHPNTSYGTAGVIPIRLIAISSFLCKDTAYGSVRPIQKPTADFSYTPSGCEPLTVQYQDRSLNSTGRRLWVFGDGSTDTLLNINRLYTNAGNYTAKLIVSNEGCYDSLQLSTAVHPLPNANFTALPASECGLPVTVQFNNQSTGATFYDWQFGNGLTSNSTQPSTIYSTEGVIPVRLIATTDFGCKDTATTTVQPAIQPRAEIGAMPNGCAPLTLQYQDRSLNATGRRLWTFADGSTDTLLNVSRLYMNHGNYTVKLMVSRGNCKDSTQIENIVYPLPEANFTALPQNVCGLPMQVQFTNQSTGATAYDWQFGSTGQFGTSNATQPANNFPTEGIIPIRLIATTAFGCKDTATTTVQPAIQPTAEIGAIPNGCAPLTLQYQDRSLNATGRRLWTFADGSTDTLLNVSRLYMNHGNYTVKLMVSRGNCKDSTQIENIVYPLPEANFTALPQNVCGLPMQVQFTNQSTGATAYDWQFGSTGQFGTSNATQPANNFPTEGIIPVRLIATTAFGCKDTAFTTVQPAIQPTAVIQATPNGCEPLTVQYQDNSLNATGSRLWVFPDGSRDTLLNVSRLYLNRGNYTVKLMVSRGLCKDSTQVERVVHPLPEANFTALPQNLCGLPMRVQFTNQSAGATAYDWQFGSTGQFGTSTAPQPNNNFPTEGIIPVRLIATTDFGCKDTATTTVQPVIQPTAAIEATPNGCAPLTVQYQDNSLNATGRRLWTFADGSTDTLLNVSRLYMSHGNYTVKLMVARGNCKDSTQVEKTVYPLPDANFTALPQNVCGLPMQVQFTNQSTGATAYDWQFGSTGQFGTSNVTQPVNNFPTEGIIPVRLIATTSFGCKDTAFTTVRPVIQPTAAIGATPNGCEPLAMQYQDRSLNATGRSFWTFGDGSTDTLLNVSRLYLSGTYTAKLVVSRGICKDSTQIESIVHPLPNANFTALPQNTCGLPMRVQFNNQSTGASFYDWQFGLNGQVGISNTAQPNVNFPTEGIIPIRLITTTNFGCKDTAFSTVRPVQQPTANFNIVPQTACVPVRVQYQNLSLNATGRLTWIYQDSLRDTIPNPSHLYTVAGTYMTKLIVTNGACKDSIELPNVVNPIPTARFTVQPTNPCGLPMQAQFTNQSIGAVGYEWQLGNSLNSTATHPNTSYATAGVTVVRLIATNQFFCKDTFYGSVHPTRQPTAAFTLTPQRGCEPLQVQFTDRSTGAIGRRYWVFGDGSTDTLLNPSHLYMTHGLYTPKLIVSNGACYDSLQLNNIVNVLQNPIADFTVRDSMIPRPTGVMLFTNQSQFAQSYVWDFGDNSGTVSQINPIHRYNRAAPHQVTLFATAANGCKDTIQKPVNPQFFSGLYVPNVFSPESGSEGIRRFLPKGSMLRTYHAAVYSAYGDLIWQSDQLIDGQPVEGWDGTRNGTPLPQDVYVWKIQATFEDGTIWVGMTDVNGRHSTVGTLTLLR